MSALCACLLKQARTSEAREWANVGRRLFPEDPGFRYWLACVAAAEGDRATAERFLADSLAGASERQSRLLRAGIDVTYAMREFDISGGISEGDSTAILSRLSDIGRDLVEIQAELQELSHEQPDRLTQSVLILLPGRAGREFLRAFSALLPASFITRGKIDRSSESPLARADRNQLNQLLAAVGRAAEINREGLVLFLYGFLLMSTERFKEAEETFAELAKTPSLAPSLSRRGPFWAAVAACLHSKKSGDPAALDQSVKYVRQYLDAGMLTPVEDARNLVGLALAAEDLGLGRDLVTAGLRKSREDPVLLCWKSEIDFASGDYLAAIKAADAALGRKPDPDRPQFSRERLAKLGPSLNQQEVDPAQVRALRAEAVQKLAEYTQEMVPGTDSP
jgi:tetratricopeptide (TPR) repeat protein